MSSTINTTVSIIIPAYNAAAFIETAVQSALGQTHNDIEVIVVDDGSLDDTAEVTRRISAKDPRMRLLSHPKSLGPSAARNTAIADATGEWIALLDADDSFAPERLACLLQTAVSRGLDAVADNLQVRDFGSEELVGAAFPESWMAGADLLTLQHLLERDYPGKHLFPSFGLIKPMVRRSFLDANSLRYEADIVIGEDFLLYSRLLLANARFGMVDAAYYRYSRRRDSVSFSRGSTFQLIEVNRRVRACLGDVSVERSPDTIGNRSDLAAILAGREIALWYQLFSWSLVNGHLMTAMKCARHIPATYLSRGVWVALRRRAVFSRFKAGAT